MTGPEFLAAPIVELRTYHLNPGRREFFDQRTRDITLPLFAKYGIRSTPFWASAEDPLVIRYVVGWDTVEEMTRKRDAMQADPLWRAMLDAPDYVPAIARAESVLMTTTAQ